MDVKSDTTVWLVQVNKYHSNVILTQVYVALGVHHDAFALWLSMLDRSSIDLEVALLTRSVQHTERTLNNRFLSCFL